MITKNKEDVSVRTEDLPVFFSTQAEMHRSLIFGELISFRFAWASFHFKKYKIYKKAARQALKEK